VGRHQEVRVRNQSKVMTKLVRGKKRMIASVALWLFGGVVGTIAADSWPSVRPQERSYHVELPSAKPGVGLTIRNLKGLAVYTIECGTYATQKPSFDYSGEFECILQRVSPAHEYSTYFTEEPHQSSDWESRARFFAYEVADPCGQIPDFGRTRSFRLRGMKIVLAMSNIVFRGAGADQKLKSFDFRISVEKDPSAVTPITEPPLLDPKWKDFPCKLDNSVSVHFRASP
jgi:hypothetical protein